MVSNTQELLNLFETKALAAGLKIDCPADGLFNSEIAIVAEAPGEREVLAKAPLVGGSGTLLWNTLRKHSLTRNDCFITNVSKRQVAFEADERRAPLSKHEFELWAELLRWELAQLPNLRVVIALGNFALKSLTGQDGITSWRGSVIPITLSSFDDRRPRMVQVLTSFNPAAVLRNPKDELIFHMDMGRIRRVLEGRWKPYQIEAIINPSFDDARGFLSDLQREREPIAYDIETMGGETACVGFANNAHRGMCINWRTFDENRYSVEQELILRHEIQNVLSSDIPLIAQNGAFDGSWLWFKDKIKVKPLWIDTMLAHHTLYPLMPHNLGFICTQYTTHPYYKDEGKVPKSPETMDGWFEYNVKDACITWSSAFSMKRELEKQHLDKFFFEHVMRIQPHLIRMTVGGIKIDLSLREHINENLREQLEVYKQNFLSAVRDATGLEGYYPNPNSPQQVADLLFNKLKLVGRGSSTNDDNRQRMYKHPKTSDASRKVLDTLTVYKEEAKFYSTYVDTDIDEDGRMRCSWNQTGVSKAPGRLSSSKVLWGHYDPKQKKVIQHGMNLQNQPKRAYEMFVCDEAGEGEIVIDGEVIRFSWDDYTFCYFDGSQAEARYVGWDVPIPTWIEQFEKARLDGKYDAHRALASQMFNIPYDDVPTADEQRLPDGSVKKTIRYIAKRCRHGLNYRMMPDRLATTTGLPIHEAQRAFELYHRINPQLRKIWWPRLEEEARANRCLYNSFGRRLFIQGRLDDPETLESIVAFRPQSTIGDKVQKVIYQSEDHSKWPHDARMGLNVHDALVALVPVKKADLCLSIMKKYMEQPIIVRPDMPELIIPADLGLAKPGHFEYDDTGKESFKEVDGEMRRWSTIQKLKGKVIEAALGD